jgi:hypothetical protein
MSVWDKVGDLARGVADWGKDIGLSGVAAPKFIWDVVTAPWNDREEFNGFGKTLRQAGIDYGKNLTRPIGGALAGLEATNRNLIREPYSALQLAAGSDVSLIGGIFSGEQRAKNKEAFGKAWENRNVISAGQSGQQFKTRNLILKDIAAITGNDNFLPTFMKDSFDIYDEKQRKAAFEDSIYGLASSAFDDAMISVVGDVSIGIGKAVKVIKAPDSSLKAIKAIDAALAGENNKYTKLAEDFGANPQTWAMNHPWIKQSNDIATSSHLLGATSTTEEALYTMKALLGDQSAVSKLDALKRPDIAEPIRIASGELTRNQLKKVLRDEKTFGSTPEGTLEFGFLRTADEIAADNEFIKTWAIHDKYLQTVVDVATPGGASLTEGIGLGIGQKIGRELSTARNVPYHSLDEANPTITAYQPTPYHRAFYKYSWGQRERQAGSLNLNEGDSIKEITAASERLFKNGLIDSETLASSIGKYAAATTPEARLVAATQIERLAFSAIGAKWGIDPQQAELIYRNWNNLRSGFLKEAKENGYVYDSIDDVNITTAIFESQSANFYPLADFAKIEQAIRASKSQLNLLWKTKDRGIASLEAVSDLWKASVLLRLGYPVRNGIDSQLRIMAAVGSMAVLKHLPQGANNVLYNTKQASTRLVDKLKTSKGGIKPPTATETKNELQKIGSDIAKTEKDIAILEAKIAKDSTDVASIAEIVAKRLDIDQKKALYASNNEALSKIEAASLKGRKRTVGQDTIDLPSTFGTADGFAYTFNNGFAGRLGELFQQLNSGAKIQSRILDDFSNMFKGKTASGTRGAVTPDMPNYYTAWASALNKDFGNSAVARQLLEGKPLDDVVDWLRNAPEGIKLRTRLKLSQDEVTEYVYQIDGYMGSYMPKGTGIREKLASLPAGERGITEKFLREAITDPSKLPTVSGFLLQEAISKNGMLTIKSAINKAFQLLGTLPEDAWARHPLFLELYNQSLVKRLTTAEGLNKGRFTQQEFQDIQYALEMGARKDALKGVKGILYNVERRSNLAQALRFISPFFSAQENSLKTWFKLAADNPVIFSRAATLYNAPNRAGFITDQNGELVGPNESYDPGATIWLQVPNALKKAPIIGKGLSSLSEVGISKRTLDVVFMGGPADLSVGPYFGITASRIIKMQPKTSAVLSWAFPYGPDDTLNQFLPTFARKILEKQQGMDNTSYARTFALIWQTEMQKARENRMPYPSEAEIKKKTDSIYNLRMWSSLILPFSPQFNSPYRMYIEKHRAYMEKFGPQKADEQFLADYPEYFSFAASLSENKTASAPTMTAVENARRYSSLISTIKDDNPALIGLITNGSSTSQFSPTAYWWQEETSVSPGSSDKFRGKQDPATSLRRNQAKEGWIKFRKVQNLIDIKLEERGLTSVTQRGAEDLAIFKSAVIGSLATEIDPVTGQQTEKISAWFEDYNDVNRAKVLKTVQGLKKVINDPVFMKDNKDNPTWKSLVLYMNYRTLLSSKLAQRESANIDAQSNSDLRAFYDAMTSKLKSEDIGFSDMYDRYLSQDPVYNKYVGE